MKLFMNRLYVMLKRTIIQPLYIVMLITLVVLSIIYVNIPDREKTIYVPAAILNEDTSSSSTEFEEELFRSKSIYHFYKVSSLDELKNDVLSGKANVGFHIPEGFFEHSYDLRNAYLITEYTTNSSRLPTVARELLFGQLFDEITPYIIHDEIYKMVVSPLIDDGTLDNASAEKLGDELSQDADSIFSNYHMNDSVFKNAENNQDKYDSITEVTKTELPVRKLAALFIFVVALMGTSSYLTDKEKNIYLIAGKGDRISLRITHIISSLLPISVISCLCLILIREMPLPELLLKMFLYMITVAVYSVLLSLILRKNHTFYRVLPVILVLTIVFSGIFFDIGKYNDTMKHLSMLFPPYYF
ncbi:MAG: ABC transporter permease [Eubacterium sp.]|nr:ABC transporter permease [Eubacterium sp.]